jgi:predicted PurR-regulated permease PerM
MTARRWRIALWLGAALAVCAAAWAASGPLVPFGVGAVIAYALTPLVDRTAALVPLPGAARDSTRRTIAVLVIYVVFGILLFNVLYLFVPIVVDQVTRFTETLPERIDAARALVDTWLEEYRRRVPLEQQDSIGRYAGTIAAEVGQTLTVAARGTVTLVTGTVSIVFGYAVVPFWMFYVLRDRPSIGRGFMQAMPPVIRDDVANALTIADHMVGRYIRGQLLLGLLVGLAAGVSLTVLGVQLSLTLGVWAGLTEMIPIIGPWIGAVPGILIVAGTQPDLLLPVALVYLVIQLLENNLLVPRVQGHAVDISPGSVILLLVIGGAAFGLPGLIVIVPTVAILRELFWYADRRLGGVPALAALAASRAQRLREAPAAPDTSEAPTDQAVEPPVSAPPPLPR